MILDTHGCRTTSSVVNLQTLISSISFNLFGEDIDKDYKIFKVHFQVIDKEEGGAVAKWTIEYEKFNEDIAPSYRYLDITTTMTKDVDAHHVAKVAKK